jgi:Rod binding domain-containing protein
MDELSDPALDVRMAASLAQHAEGGRVLHGLARAGSTPRPGNAEAAREFEGYLLRVLLDEMRRTVTSGGLFDGRATAGYQAMLDDALMRQAAARGGLGLANQLLAEWEAKR